MLAVAPLKEEGEEKDINPLPDEQTFPYTLQSLDKEEEMEILSSIKQETEESTRDRLVDSLAASYPAGCLSKLFQVKDEDNDPLSTSCFAEIRLDKSSKMDEGFDSDEELTSLSWLHDTDLLSGLRVGSECGSPADDDGQKENDFQSGIYGQPHPPHVPYNPQKHINSKPPYSFSCLIFMAIEDNPDKKLPVKDIYNWILTHFPYFQNAPTGWKNSVRHNLSLNKCFKKVEKDRCSNIGKGSLWMIDPDFRPNLLQALRKTPYHPYHQLQMFNNAPATSPCSINGTQKPLPLQPRYNVNTPSPHLFPFLSRRLAQSNFVSSGTDVSVSDIDVANTLVSLKRAAENRRHRMSRSRSPSPPEFGSEREKELLKQKKLRAGSREEVVWYAPPPSDDHSYSLTEDLLQQGAMSPESSIDEEYDFGTNDKSTSELEDEIFSESDYDEEGWSEEEELYEREKLKLYSRAPIITHDSVASQAGSIRGRRDGRYVDSRTRGADLLLKASSAKNHHHHKQQLRNPPPLRRVGGDVRHHQAGRGVGNQHQNHQSITITPSVRDPEEDLKIAEGANALLNLAGIRSAHIVPLRSISPSNNNNNIVKLEHVKVEEMET